MLITAGCSATPERENRVPPESPSAQDALKFGGVVLPTSAEVLGVARDTGIDQTPPGGAAPAVRRRHEPVVGFELHRAAGARPGPLREGPGGRVLVDRTDPATSTVHLRLFTT
ncbi:hypothetical protein [Kibdelosporangium phytohabitans]|uniref:Uncharacterized protein n=1 Tax=Kibdelosporangium phytohabitans TaxID=860235 RepID=A0A0N9HV22_9PSEU|nr:hypothetical protein [Kibdelosporangium phytohabitans]ALG07366.1 hypothetical protein AOZ06_10920 [Kibdelosporangium phytohabitans]MBE1471757.1 hypothetical protein [Kibdelosporangium phytohabitans]